MRNLRRTIISIKQRSSEIFIIFLFSIITILVNRKLITTFFSRMQIIRIIDCMPLYINNYFWVFLPNSAWNDFLSAPSFGGDYLSIRFLFAILSIVFQLTPYQIAIIERIVAQNVAFLSMFFLSRYYLLQHFKKANKSNITVAAFMAGLFYGISPSFMIGDLARPVIEFAYANIPLIVLFYDKGLTKQGKKVIYIILTALIMAINIDEHFIWAGYPILLFLYTFYYFVATNIQYFCDSKIQIKNLLFEFLKTFSIFVTVIFTFICLILYRLLGRIFITSEYTLSLTKAGVDVVWIRGTIFNMIRAITHMNLNFYYSPLSSPIFQIFDYLMPITFLIPILSFSSILLNKTKKNKVIVFYSLLTALFIIPFYSGSPLKWVHYWLFFNTPFGPAFRTWRIMDGFISLSLSVLLGFSICNILIVINILKKNRDGRRYLKKRIDLYLKFFFLVSLTLVYLVYAWPLFFDNTNGELSPLTVPDEYQTTYTFLKNHGESTTRVIYIPEFIYSYGKNSNLKPFWSKEWGMIPEFLVFSSPLPTLWPGGFWSHFIYFTVSPFYKYSLLRQGETDILAYFLTWSNIKYLVIHNDIPNLTSVVTECLAYLNSSKLFKLVYQRTFIYVFENLLLNSSIEILNNKILVDGGFRALKRFIYAINENLSFLVHTTGFFFIDQNITQDVLESSKIIVTDKTEEQLVYDLLFTYLLNNNTIESKEIYFPYDYTLEYAPKMYWSRASYLNPHQQEWHPFIRGFDYAWDFDYMKGLAFTVNSNDTLEIPITEIKHERYHLFVRYFANVWGGNFTIKIGSNCFNISSKDSYNGFKWRVLNFTSSGNETEIRITNKKGFNALSALVLIPDNNYYKTFLNEIFTFLDTKKVIQLNVLELSSISCNLSSDFATRINLINLTTNYTIHPTIFSKSPLMNLNNTCSYCNYYFAIVHPKIKEHNKSYSIYVEGINSSSSKKFVMLSKIQNMRFVPKKNIAKVNIPLSITKIRVKVALSKEYAMKTIGEGKFFLIMYHYLKGDSSELLEPPKSSIYYIKKLSSSLWKIKVFVDDDSPIVKFSESFSHYWIAEEYINNRLVIKHTPKPLYGVINGFIISERGYVEINIKYTLDDLIAFGYSVSYTTLLICVTSIVCFYLKKFDRMNTLKTKIKEFIFKLNLVLRNVTNN